MLTLLFGVDVLISGWVTALLLAFILTVFFGQTRFYSPSNQSKESVNQNGTKKYRFRWKTRIVTVIGLSAVLAFLLNQKPAADSGLAALLNLHQHDFWQGRNSLVLDDLEVSLAVLFLILFITGTNRIYTSLYEKIEAWGHNHFRTIRIQRLDLVTRKQIAAALIQVVKTTRFSLLILISAGCFVEVLSLYPLTSSVSYVVIEWVSEIVISLWKNAQAFFPNLFMLVLISMGTRLALKVMEFFYDAFWKGTIQIQSLHPELVEPTYQLLRLLVIAFALVAAFPYIPGSSSPVFRAISIFAGFLLSLGSTSLASNIVSGIVLTYTRGMRIGDRVRVAEITGDVVERTLLVTRIRTNKNVVITIPNAKVMQNEVNNFSAQAEADGLILHTTVTIGYDVPWRQVDDLLVHAALKTPEILEHPVPFVLKTSLDNYYISYELNAYTENANRMAKTYSQLHENILDEFNQAEVEIMSPAYMSLRDGEHTTIAQKEAVGKPSWKR